MKRIVAWGFRAGTVLLLIGLGVRLLWLAAETETGLETLRTQWRDATVGWFVGNYQPVPQRDPPAQADFWLPKVNRVLEAHPQDARLAMGAALVLDTPSFGFISRYLKYDSRIPGIVDFPGYKEIGPLVEVFEKRCKPRCLEIAARAVELEPQNRAWQRLRALLLLYDVPYCSDDTPRDSRWLDILEKSARHDPDNALYDYLAAYFYWMDSSKWDFSGKQDRLVIHDVDKFSKGIERFEHGQAKKYLSVGDAGFSAVLEFLRHTRIPLTDQYAIVNSRGIHLHRSTLLHRLWRWQMLRAAEKAIAGDVPAALALERQNLWMIAQFTARDRASATDAIATASKVATASTMKNLADAHQDLLDESEQREITELQKTAMLEKKVIEQAARDLARIRPQPSSGLFSTASPSTWAELLAIGLLPSLVILLLSMGVVTYLLARRFADSKTPAVGPIGQIVAWLLAVLFTAALLGLAPAEMISREVQAWVFTLSLFALPIAVVAGIGWLWLRRRQFQYSLLALMVVTVIFALFSSLIAAVYHAGGFSDLPINVAMPLRGWKGIDPELLHNALTPNGETWVWAVYQWYAYAGPYVTVLLWAVLVPMFFSWKWRKRRRQAAGAIPTFRQRIGGYCHSLARPAFGAALLLLGVYLLLTPHYLLQVEKDFQQKITFARDPEAYWKQVEALVEKIRADKKKMEQFRKDVEAELSPPEGGEAE
ncbi:MAG: hypothetical protein JXB10_10810 [Pirellulales bacterium]|nr:hypothetical protein [Pirellulales bacterium]